MRQGFWPISFLCEYFTWLVLPVSSLSRFLNSTRISEEWANNFSRRALRADSSTLLILVQGMTGNMKKKKKRRITIEEISSVPQSCLTLCDPTDRSTPGFPVLHYLPEFAQTHGHWVGDAIQPSHPLSSPSPPAPNLSQHQGLFQRAGPLHQGAEVLELNSASVLSVNMQRWFPLGLIGAGF